MLLRLFAVAAMLLLAAPPADTQTVPLHTIPPADTLAARLAVVLNAYPDATVGLAVWDEATSTHFALNGDRPFHAASTMKVAVMIEVFRQAEAGGLQLDDSLDVHTTFRSVVDGTPFDLPTDSDDPLFAARDTRVSVRTLTARMITHSSNLATNLLLERVTPAAVQQTAERLGTQRLRVRRGVEDLAAFRQGLNNETTANDLARLFDALRTGRAVSPSADAAMREILHAQAFREMIPAGLPPGTRVAHKTGQITHIHHDAALVVPPDQPPYVLVILIEGLDDDTRSAALGAALTQVVHTFLRT